MSTRKTRKTRSNPFVGRPGTKGVHAIVYHGSRSTPDVFAKQIKEGFQFRGAGGIYGFGLYTVFREDRASRTFSGYYGNYVYRIAVPVRDYLVFDFQAAQEVYGENPPTVVEQMTAMGIYTAGCLGDKEKEGRSWEAMKNETFSSVVAMAWFTEVLRAVDAGKDVKLPNGIVFYGAQDGHVCVVLNPENMAVTGYMSSRDKDFQPVRFAGRDWRTELGAPQPWRLVLGDFSITQDKAFWAIVEHYARGKSDKEKTRIAGILRKRLQPLGVYRDAADTESDEETRNTYYAFSMPGEYGQPQIHLVGRKLSDDTLTAFDYGGDLFVTIDPELNILTKGRAGYEAGTRTGARETGAARPALGVRYFSGYDDDGPSYSTRLVPVITPKKARNNPTTSSFRLDDLDSEQLRLLAAAFRKSYLEATGAAWSESTFFSRARSWRFYGEVSPTRTGVVAIRPQRSGMNKLVAVAGDPRAVLGGIKALMVEKKDEPVWGAVSEDLVPLCERYGLIAVHTKPGGVLVLRTIAQLIPPDVLGGSTVTVLPDGALQLHVVEIGQVEKYFVANKAYFAQLAAAPGIPLPSATTWLLQRFVDALL